MACTTSQLVGAACILTGQPNCCCVPALQIPECSKAYLLDAEEEAKARKSQKSSTVWDDKMRATQTDSAFGVRVC